MHTQTFAVTLMSATILLFSVGSRLVNFHLSLIMHIYIQINEVVFFIKWQIN